MNSMIISAKIKILKYHSVLSYIHHFPHGRPLLNVDYAITDGVNSTKSFSLLKVSLNQHSTQVKYIGRTCLKIKSLLIYNLLPTSYFSSIEAQASSQKSAPGS